MIGKLARNRWARFGSVLMLIAIVMLTAAGVQGRGRRQERDSDAPSERAGAAEQEREHSSRTDALVTYAPAPITRGSNGMTMSHSVHFVRSRALRDMPKVPNVRTGPRKEQEDEGQLPIPGHRDGTDPVVQRGFGRATSPAPGPAISAPITSFDGIGFQSGIPPDTNGDVGPNHYVQTVNSAVDVWNKSGTELLGGAVDINSLWFNAGDFGPCGWNNDGDPVVLYDRAADRWLLTQFTAESPYSECIAISTTGDPTGVYNLYTFQLSQADFEDYPKFGVWPDGYYMSMNEFAGGSTYNGPKPYVFNRSELIAGASTVHFQWFPALGNGHAPMLPADLDGTMNPPSGAPNYFIEGNGNLLLWKFHVDWANPANSTFTNAKTLTTAAFTQLCPTTRNCIPQRGTTQTVDGLGDRLMNRLAYRRFSDHESMVVNQSVNAGGKAGVRWYEIRNPSTSPVLYQQGTFAPDSNHRWGASVAMDKKGDIAAGYSVSSSTVFPSIRYTARLLGDPLGQMTQGEGTLYSGSGSQAGTDNPVRWGDYSNLSADPADECTFWYTTEYNNSFDWSWGTRIGSFRLPQCLDNTAPTVATPGQGFVVPATLPSTATTSPLPVRITWSATDTSGIGAYQLQQKTDTGAFASVALSPATATSIVRNLTPGHTYQFQVRAMDKVGNWSAYKPGPSFAVGLTQENGSGLAYSSGWTSQANTAASGGALRFASTAGSSVTFSFTGRNVAWVAPKDSTRGQAQVFIDGATTAAATVNLNSSTALSRQVVYTKSWTTSAAHTLKIVVSGTSGHPRVDVDAFATLR